MKCVIHTETGVLDRVKDSVAQERVARGTWLFINKETWKQQLKDEMEARAKERNSKKNKKKGKKNENNNEKR